MANYYLFVKEVLIFLCAMYAARPHFIWLFWLMIDLQFGTVRKEDRGNGLCTISKIVLLFFSWYSDNSILSEN